MRILKLLTPFILLFISSITYALNPADYISDVNKHMPMMVNQNVRADFMGATKNKIVFHYTFVNQTVSSININQFRNHDARNLKNRTCTSPDSKYFLDRGMTFDYRYFDMYGNYLLNVKIAPSDCR